MRRDEPTPPAKTPLVCPSSELWHAFVRGRLPDPQLADLSMHLDLCPACQDVLTTLEESDSAVDLLHRGRPHYCAEPELHELTEALRTSHAQLSRWSATGDGRSAHARLPRHVPSTLDEYRLLEPLGAGAAGRVYKAVHQRLHKTVALKLLAPKRKLHRDLVERFEREMRAVGQIEHPNVVAATDAGEAGGFHFLVMEYAPGLDVGEIVERLHTLPIPDACEIVRQAALGVQAAHERGLIHRDIKPSNLLLTDTGNVKVLDLGLVTLKASGGRRRMHRSTLVGTPHYMAPEQWQSRGVDVAADVYSLGCTLFKLITGVAPYEDVYRTHQELQRAHCQNAVPDLVDLRPETPEGLNAVVSRALEKAPQERFPSAGELAEALGQWSHGADVAACIRLARAVASAETLSNAASETLSKIESGTAPRRRTWRRAVMVLALLLAAGGVLWAALFPSRDAAGWETKIPASTKPLFCQAGRDPEVEIAPIGAANELVLNAGGRTLLQAGEAADESYCLRTSLSLDPNERAGLFFGAELLGFSGINVALVEVLRKPDQREDHHVEYVITVRHLFHNPEDAIPAREINNDVRATSIHLADTVSRATLELRSDGDRIEIYFAGARAFEVQRTDWEREAANIGMPALAKWTGPFGFYVLRGKVEFSHIRYLDL